MIYCINIMTLAENLTFRLQSNGNWQLCTNTAIVLKSDFITRNRQKLLKMINTYRRKVIEIGGRDYKIEPKFKNCCQDKVALFDLYGFRYKVPGMPDVQQMIREMKSGNNAQNNILTVDTKAEFELIRPEQLKQRLPDIAVYFPMWRAQSGVVGWGVDSELREAFLWQVYATALQYWKRHIGNNRLFLKVQDYFDGTMDEFLDLINEIKMISRQPVVL